MKRHVSPEKQREYDELKLFFTHWEMHINPYCKSEAADPSNPLNALKDFETRIGVSRTLPGLRQAINDVLEMTEDWPADAVSSADTSLASVGALTLTHLRHRRSRQYKAILRRGRLRNDTELYLISGILSDMTIDLPEAESQALESMVADYELRRA